MWTNPVISELTTGFKLAERVGFEPTDGFTRQTISSRSRYDLFDTAPYETMEIDKSIIIHYKIKFKLSTYMIFVLYHRYL